MHDLCHVRLADLVPRKRTPSRGNEGPGAAEGHLLCPSPTQPLLQGWLETGEDLAPRAAAERFIPEFRATRRREVTTWRAGPQQVTGKSSRCRQPPPASPGCRAGKSVHREDYERQSQPNACAESLVWKSHHTCTYKIIFKILIIPRAAGASPFSKRQPVRSPACQTLAVLPPGGRTRAKGSEHEPGPTWRDLGKGVCPARGRAARSRGLHGLQERLCGEVSANPTRSRAELNLSLRNKAAARTCAPEAWLNPGLGGHCYISRQQALSSAVGHGEKDRQLPHPSPTTSCCREGWGTAASASSGRGLQALHCSSSFPKFLQLLPTLPCATSSSSLIYIADRTRLTASF